MRRGPWHQCGDRSQRLVLEQLELGAGVGVILSPRDLSLHNAATYAQAYQEQDAHVLIDQQFYVPDFSNENLNSYEMNEYRASVSKLHQITEQELAGFATRLEEIHKNLSADGVIAPAIMYEAGRPDIIELNAQLFNVSKRVGDSLGVPTYATIVLSRSVTSSDQTVKTILSHATALDCDGWYYSFEFDPERIPSSRDMVLRCCATGLKLACTGKPVLHAYAGPMALLSLGFGAAGATIGHSQNLWKFTRGRWQPPSGQGGGGNAPARFFSKNLWGTIIYPDEVAQLTPTLRSQILTLSPFSAPVTSNLLWSRWDANKHLVYVTCSAVADMATTDDPRTNAVNAISLLQEAIDLHANIAEAGLSLRDFTNVYQGNWQAAMNDLLDKHSDDFEYLALLE